MVTATKKMQQIENDIKVNKRNYRISRCVEITATE